MDKNIRVSDEQIKKKLEEKRPDVIFISSFRKDGRIKLNLKCKICNHEWEAYYFNALESKKCPKCCRKRVTLQEFIEKLEKVNKDIEVIGDYKTSNDKIKVKCKICGNIWEATPNNLLRKRKCPACSRKNASLRNLKSHEQFIKDLKEENEYIEVLGHYETAKTKIKVKCKRCGYIWSVTPDNLLRGRGCPKCKVSVGERRILKFLDRHNIKYEMQYSFKDCKYINPLRFDFYLKDFNILLEFDGDQHFHPADFTRRKGITEEELENFEIVKKRDKIKDEYCLKNNIKLIRISYWDFNNIEKILNKELLNIST